jgi:hypothetical protein
MDISGSMLWNPSKSLWKMAHEENIRLVTVEKMVQEQFQLLPYKVTGVQELKQVDHEKRTHYCE